MHYRLLAALLFAWAIAASGAVRADDEKPARDGKVERTLEKTGRTLDKAATKAGKWIDRNARRAAGAVGRAAEKTDRWIRKKTE